MKAPDIQFARARRGTHVLVATVLALGVGVVAATAYRYDEGMRTLERVEADMRGALRAAERPSDAPGSAAGTRISEQRVRAINHAIARLNVPWSELFGALEGIEAGQVALLALLPDVRNRTLVLQAEALQPQAMLEFVERLRSLPVFDEVHLTNHERREQEVGQPYRFAVEARWKEPA